MIGGFSKGVKVFWMEVNQNIDDRTIIFCSSPRIGRTRSGARGSSGGWLGR